MCKMSKMVNQPFNLSSWAKITATFSQSIFFYNINNFLIVMRFASSSQRHDQSFISLKKTPKSSVYFLTPT
jgi:hypothetical protein